MTKQQQESLEKCGLFLVEPENLNQCPITYRMLQVKERKKRMLLYGHYIINFYLPQGKCSFKKESFEFPG